MSEEQMGASCFMMAKEAREKCLFRRTPRSSEQYKRILFEKGCMESKGLKEVGRMSCVPWHVACWLPARLQEVGPSSFFDSPFTSLSGRSDGNLKGIGQVGGGQGCGKRPWSGDAGRWVASVGRRTTPLTQAVDQVQSSSAPPVQELG